MRKPAGERRIDAIKRKFAEMPEADALQKAKDSAFRLLEYRSRSRAELDRRLTEKGYPSPVVQKVLAELERLGLVNDEEFAQAWVESRMQARPSGARALLWELRRKGVDDAIAASTVESSVGEEEELQLAGDLARSKWSKLQKSRALTGLERRAELAKIGRFLAGRGFSFDVIKQVINKLNGEGTEDES